MDRWDLGPYLNGVIGTSMIKAEPLGWAITVVENPCEEVSIAPQERTRLPNHLQSGFIDTLGVVIVVIPCEKEGIESHLMQVEYTSKV